MPLVDSNDPALWDGGPTSLYRDGEGRGYADMERCEYPLSDHYRLREVLDIQPGQPIIIVGAGFGWVADDWEAVGLGPILCLDTSDYIHAHKHAHARRPILNVDVGDVNLREVLSNGERAHWCISEDVVPLLTDEEAEALAVRMCHAANKVVHWISCGVRRGPNPMEGVEGEWAGDKRLNWKSLEEWKALLDPDIVVARNENGRML